MPSLWPWVLAGGALDMLSELDRSSLQFVQLEAIWEKVNQLEPSRSRPWTAGCRGSRANRVWLEGHSCWRGLCWRLGDLEAT